MYQGRTDLEPGMVLGHENLGIVADIFPTGWHCTRLADMQPGDSMVVYGDGPVGLMAAYSAMIMTTGRR